MGGGVTDLLQITVRGQAKFSPGAVVFGSSNTHRFCVSASRALQALSVLAEILFDQVAGFFGQPCQDETGIGPR